jgi:uncharacterized membrane protein
MKRLFLILLLAGTSYAFSIESYYTHATVLENGDLNVYERIAFDLDEQYNEGFRSIRPQDAPSPSSVTVHSVKVNGNGADFYTQTYQGNTEIVWTETFPGKNAVELNYTLKDRVEVFDDFARVCFEHFGAGWPVSAKAFEARMTLPESSRGKDMHFEIYSAKEGEAFVEDLAVVTRISDVPPGNYVGGCYLFFRDSVSASRSASGSALEILKSERESYGSREILAPEEPFPFELFCVPLALMLAILSAAVHIKRRSDPKLPESILPPGRQEPAVVAALVNSSYDEKDLLAATLLELINKGAVDIAELEKKGETSAEVKKERTMLFLKKREGLDEHEQAVVDMIFSQGDEVDLDALAAKFSGITSRAEAMNHPITKAMERFDSVMKSLLQRRKMWELVERAQERKAIAASFGMFVLFFILFFGCVLVDAASYYLEQGSAVFLALIGSFVVLIVSLAYLAYVFITPRPPKELDEEYGGWDAFRRGLQSSRIKEYPPSSAVIWGEILVYATALGLAERVKRHLSELDAFTLKRVEEMERVRRSSYVFYGSALGVRNLSKYGNRSGVRSGGFSGRSSGGWSSRGGGGFSGGRSGGGGFR